MTEAEQEEHRHVCNAVRGALSLLRLTRCTDEDVAVAKARLDNWLAENDGRWVRDVPSEFPRGSGARRG